MKLIDNTGLSYLIGKIKTMIGLKADKTYVDNKVKTDVPAGAKFTDTKTTINGKTGVILKDDIVALGILAQGTELQLGNFKFVFNADENSLDFEVLA